MVSFHSQVTNLQLVTLPKTDCFVSVFLKFCKTFRKKSYSVEHLKAATVGYSYKRLQLAPKRISTNCCYTVIIANILNLSI